MKLWCPQRLAETNARPFERPGSTRKVVFPADAVIEEVLALAGNAAKQLPTLNQGFAKMMGDYR